MPHDANGLVKINGCNTVTSFTFMNSAIVASLTMTHHKELFQPLKTLTTTLRLTFIRRR